MAETTHFMDLALAEAQAAGERDEVPIGAVLVYEGRVVACSGNRTRELNDITAHAEINVIRLACEELGQERLPGSDLYVTLEPCTMCAAAISFARIRRLYYGANDAKGGAVESGVRFYNQSTCHHAPEVYSGIAEVESGEILRGFFQGKRER